MKIENSRSAGFSLIEVVFAMSFLIIIVFGVISLQSSNLSLISRQNNQIQAHFYANQGVEIVEALGYNPSFAGCTPCQKKIKLTGSDYSLPDLGGTNEAINDTFERLVEIDTTGLIAAKAYKVTAIIEWEDATGAHRRFAGGEKVNAHVEANRIIYDQ